MAVLCAEEELDAFSCGGLVDSEQGVGGVRVPGLSVKVPPPAWECAVELPDDTTDVVARGHVLQFVLVLWVVADCRQEARECPLGFFGSVA